MPQGILDDTIRMPKVDPDDSTQNAFVQDWLIAWAKEHTVYGSNDWEKEAKKWMKKRAKWAKEWHVTETKLVREAMLFEAIMEHIQGTYDYTKDRSVLTDPWEEHEHIK